MLSDGQDVLSSLAERVLNETVGDVGLSTMVRDHCSTKRQLPPCAPLFMMTLFNFLLNPPGFLGTREALGMATFERDRRTVAGGAVAPLGVVEHLDVVEDIGAGVATRGVALKAYVGRA